MASEQAETAAAAQRFEWPHSPENAGRPLEGVKILDFSRVLAGPFCAMILADLGADVIKVEAPGGDETRRWGPPFFKDTATYFYGTNRNKWGVVLDLRRDDDRAAAARLIAEADVIIQNFTADVAQKLGVDYDSLCRLNPSAVCLTLSAFGSHDPERRGYDLIIQALSGVMAMTGDAAGPPAKVGIPISDLSAAFFGTIGVLGALHARRDHNRGTHIEVSLYDAALALLANQSANWLLAQTDAERMGSEHPNLAPYGAFDAADGSIILGVGSDGQFAALCEVLGAPELAGRADFATNMGRVANRDALRAELESRLRARPAKEWCDALNAREVPNALVRSVGEALEAEETHTIASTVSPWLGEIPQVMSPIRINGEYQAPYLAPPVLGEHSWMLPRHDGA